MGLVCLPQLPQLGGSWVAARHTGEDDKFQVQTGNCTPGEFPGSSSKDSLVHLCLNGSNLAMKHSNE